MNARESIILENWSIVFRYNHELSEKESEFFRDCYGSTNLSSHQFNWLNDIGARLKKAHRFDKS